MASQESGEEELPDELVAWAKRVTEELATAVDTEALIAAGAIEKKGGWYAILDWDKLPKTVQRKIKAFKKPNLVKFNKPWRP